jgi:hypothetical protein
MDCTWQSSGLKGGRQGRAGRAHGIVPVVLSRLAGGIRSGGGVSQQARRFHGDPPVASRGSPPQARGAENREPAAGIRPVRDIAIAGALQQVGKRLRGELVGILCVDAFAGAECARAAGPGHAHRALRFQVHFDARAGAVEERDMAPVVHVEIGVQHLVDVPQQVQVEGGRQVQRVVIRRFQHLLRLDPVHADQQPRRLRIACGSAAAWRARRRGSGCRCWNRDRRTGAAAPECRRAGSARGEKSSPSAVICKSG